MQYKLHHIKSSTFLFLLRGETYHNRYSITVRDGDSNRCTARKGQDTRRTHSPEDSRTTTFHNDTIEPVRAIPLPSVMSSTRYHTRSYPLLDRALAQGIHRKRSGGPSNRYGHQVTRFFSANIISMHLVLFKLAQRIHNDWSLIDTDGPKIHRTHVLPYNMKYIRSISSSST